MNHWNEFWKHFRQKREACRGQPTFWIYFWCAVVLAGSCGIWVALGQQFRAEKWNWAPVVSALFTYFPALAAGSAFELVMPQESKRFVRALAIGAVIFIAGLAAISIWLATGIVAFVFCVAGYIISLALWFLANADNPNLHELPPPETATGGDATRPPGGDLDGFITT